MDSLVGGLESFLYPGGLDSYTFAMQLSVPEHTSSRHLAKKRKQSSAQASSEQRNVPQCSVGDAAQKDFADCQHEVAYAGVPQRVYKRKSVDLLLTVNTSLAESSLGGVGGFSSDPIADTHKQLLRPDIPRISGKGASCSYKRKCVNLLHDVASSVSNTLATAIKGKAVATTSDFGANAFTPQNLRVGKKRRLQPYERTTTYLLLTATSPQTQHTICGDDIVNCGPTSDSAPNDSTLHNLPVEVIRKPPAYKRTTEDLLLPAANSRTQYPVTGVDTVCCTSTSGEVKNKMFVNWQQILPSTAIHSTELWNGKQLQHRRQCLCCYYFVLMPHASDCALSHRGSCLHVDTHYRLPISD